MKAVSIEVPEELDEKDVKLAVAIEAFRRGLISAGKAAELAGLPLQALYRGVEEERHASLQV